MATIDEYIIQKIIDSEKLAQAAVNEAREERRSHEAKAQAEIDAYREKTLLETDAAIARLAQAQREQSNAEVEKIGREADRQAAALRETAEARMPEWVDALYCRILGGEIG
jgi:vacuolar-type H+-ATPase subunit H